MGCLGTKTIIIHNQLIRILIYLHKLLPVYVYSDVDVIDQNVTIHQYKYLLLKSHLTLTRPPGVRLDPNVFHFYITHTQRQIFSHLPIYALVKSTMLCH